MPLAASRFIIAIIIRDEDHQMVVLGDVRRATQCVVQRGSTGGLAIRRQLPIDSHQFVANAQDIPAAAMRLDFDKLLVVEDDRPDAVAPIDGAPGG